MFNSQIVWIFGPSAVGKKTLMMDTARKTNHFIPDALQMTDPIVYPFVFQGGEEIRMKQLEAIYLMASDSNSLKSKADHLYLIHGQGEDFHYKNIKRLYKQWSGMFKYCVMVEIDEESYNERASKRYIEKGVEVKYDHKTAYETYKKIYGSRIDQFFKNILVAK